MLKNAWLLLVAAALALAGCAVQPALASHEAIQSDTIQSAAAERSQSLPDGGQKAGVRDTDGASRANVPWVTNLPNDTPNADTVRSGAPASMLGRHEILQGWDTLVNLVDKTKATWYINEIDARSNKSGISWSDIVSWASARDKNGRLVEARIIEILGHNISEDEARRRAAEIVGGTEVAARLPIVRHPREFMNTWTPDGKTMSDYLFSPTEAHAVRVSLAPLKLNGKGQVIGIYKNTQSGVFVDCYNLWWLPLAVNTTSGEPPAPPSNGTPPPTPGGNTPPPATPGGGTPPPPVPPTPVPPAKQPAFDPVSQGNASNGGGMNEDPGPGVFIQPQEMKQPPAAPRVNPDPPAAAPTPVPPALEIPPAPAPAPELEAPVPDNPATSCIPAPGEDDC